MNTGTITGVNGNMLSVRFEAAVAQNEVGYAVLGDLRLMCEVVRIRRDEADMQVFEDTSDLAVGGKVEFTGVIDVGNADRLPIQGDVGADIVVVGFAGGLVVQTERGKRNLLAGGAAQGDAQRIGTHNGEPQVIILAEQIQGGCVGVAQ